MFWFCRANVYQNRDFKKLYRDILKICRFLRFFLWNHKFLRTFALPFGNEGKYEICGEICLLATTRKNAKM